MTTMANNGAAKTGRPSRPTLCGQLDRLDGMLDGLSEALNESVADAVRVAVGRTVREAVEAAVRDVLDDPDLVRAAVARHAPVAAHAAPAPRPTLAQALGRTVCWLCALAAGKAGEAGAALGHGWTWALAKVREACGAASDAARLAANALPALAALAWRHKAACAAALGVGALVGVLAYFAGPLVSSSLCGLGGAAVSLGGWLLAGVCRPFGGR